MKRKKIRLIVSPVSRPAWVKRYLPEVIQVLEEGGCAVEVCVTEAAGDPGRLAEESRGRFEAVVVAGGDGSINEAMNALRGSDTSVGIIPFGTVNVFAREMGIPLQPVAAARAFHTGRVKSLDMGRIKERSFLLMASYGFDVQAMRRNPRWLKSLAGRYSYVITSLLLLPFYRDRWLEVCLDGEPEKRRANFAIFSNARCYAGDYVVAPEADMSDGLLDLLLCDCPGPLGMLKIFRAISKGTMAQKEWAWRGRARGLGFTTQAPDWFQVDGDPVDGVGDRVVLEKGVIRAVLPG